MTAAIPFSDVEELIALIHAERCVIPVDRSREAINAYARARDNTSAAMRRILSRGQPALDRGEAAAKRMGW